ncbi:MAG: hypothetical protein M1820_007727 [Bogoriella megaspora]|nr:MAG: hypothetical protein M1820_007727 [Bogoriella megaspora]
MGNPYGPSTSQLSRFPFAARGSTQQAPLFYSATDEFGEEDAVEEHEREVADFYAMQRSRRQIGASHLTESTSGDDGGSKASDDEEEDHVGGITTQDFDRTKGIRSSWKGSASTRIEKSRGADPIPETAPSSNDSDTSGPNGRVKGKLIDVDLASTMRESIDNVRREEASADVDPDYDDRPAPFQQFRNPPGTKTSRYLQTFMPVETDEEAAMQNPRPPSPDRESVPTTVTVANPEPTRHDQFWATLYWIALASMFSSFVLVYLHTSAPTREHPLPDTIYKTLHASFHLLAVDTLVAIIVAMLWLAVLRSFVRPLVLLILIAVPVILFSFSLYPFVSSYKGAWHGTSVQDKAMRWLSFLPSICALFWSFMVWRSRHSLSRATEILEFACRILASSPVLLMNGFGTLGFVVLWTWLWMAMFARVFLGGHFLPGGSKNLFVIDLGTWWLGAFFCIVYLWTLSIASGIQRSTTAATVSQWYFHRLQVPAPSSRAVVTASFVHATGSLFGTICLSTLLSLLIRLPLLLLPRRLAGVVTLAAYNVIPTSIATLTNPLTLTYAAIHSQSLSQAARGLSQMSFISKTSPTTTLSPQAFSGPRFAGPSSTLLPYRLSKLILHATRFIMAIALGVGGWVSTARLLTIESDGSGTVRGSLYAYVVGLIAGAIGWGVLGATEGVLGGILDAAVICWGSETQVGGADGRGEARYCREAGELFGDGDGGEGRRVRL